MITELKAAKRSKTGKEVAGLRKIGTMPAVVYGPKQEALSIEVSTKDFGKVLDEAGESTVINLSIDGEGHNVLIHEVDRDPISDMPRHADFYAIVKGQKVKVHIPLVFVGESAAVKEGANLVKALHEIEVEADPMNLPHELNADIALLATVGAQLTAKDIVLPEGVSLVTDGDEVVATILEAKEEVEEPVAQVDMTAIGDSVERGKGEEEGEAGAADAETKEENK